jgi:hypothetical protein
MALDLAAYIRVFVRQHNAAKGDELNVLQAHMQLSWRDAMTVAPNCGAIVMF